MGKKNNIIGLLLICMIIFVSMRLTVMASGKQQTEQGGADSTKEDIRRELLDEYADDPEFQNFLKIDPEGAEAYINELVEDRCSRMGQNSGISVASTGAGGKEAYCTVPVKKQTGTKNCSAATILQTLYGLGKQSQVAGSTDSAKQDTIFNNYTTNKSAPGARNPNSANTTLTVLEVTVFLNRFVSSEKYKSTCFAKDSGELSKFKAVIWQSLTHNRPVVLHARKEAFEYYKDETGGHYLSLDLYTKDSEKVQIKDCNYKSPYGGSHTVPVKEAYDSVKSGRYVIAGQ